MSLHTIQRNPSYSVFFNIPPVKYFHSFGFSTTEEMNLPGLPIILCRDT